MAISRWRTHVRAKREATRHKPEVAGSMPGLTSGCAFFYHALHKLSFSVITRRDHAGVDGDLRASLFGDASSKV